MRGMCMCVLYGMCIMNACICVLYGMCMCVLYAAALMLVLCPLLTWKTASSHMTLAVSGERVYIECVTHDSRSEWGEGVHRVCHT